MTRDNGDPPADALVHTIRTGDLSSSQQLLTTPIAAWPAALIGAAGPG